MIGDLMTQGEVVFTEWFSREADNAYFFCEVVTFANLAEVAIDIYHKNAEEAGDGTNKESFTTITSATIGEKESLGLKELVRFRITISNGGGGGVSTARVRFLSPIWFNKGPAP